MNQLMKHYRFFKQEDILNNQDTPADVWKALGGYI